MLIRRRRNKNRGLAVCLLNLPSHMHSSVWILHNRGSVAFFQSE